MKSKIKSALNINQKWYVTLLVAVVINIGWNYTNTKATFKQGQRITELEKENLALKKTNIELLSKDFLGQRSLDRLPFALWRKVKRGNTYIMKFINNTGKKQFLEDRGIDRYYYHNKTDFAVFPYDEAIKFQREDSIVANAVTDTVAHFDTDFYDSTGKILIKDGYTRWREISEDGDTLVWGKMDGFYKPAKIKKNGKR